MTVYYKILVLGLKRYEDETQKQSQSQKPNLLISLHWHKYLELLSTKVKVTIQSGNPQTLALECDSLAAPSQGFV